MVRVETEGETRVERLLWATLLGDLVSLELARRRGVDPEQHRGDRPAQGGDGRMRAMVLAAGLGTRLRPITYEMPKPMVPVLNKPVMEHILRLLARHGFTETIANLHWFPELIEGYFGDGSGQRRLAHLQPRGAAARDLGRGPQRGRVPRRLLPRSSPATR